MSANAYYKAACDSCRGRIEYPADLAGHLVACPHCAHLTRLTLPPALLPAVSKPVSETSVQLRDRIRRDSGYAGFRSIVAVIHVVLLLAAAVSFIVGLRFWLEPSAVMSQREAAIVCAGLLALGSVLILGAMVLKLGLTTVFDIADALLDASRRSSPK